VSGLVGSPHCAGMCGPFAAACGSSPRRFGAWHLGRLGTYSVLGGVAGGFGYLLPGPSWVGGVVSALFVIGFSAVLAGLVPEPRLGGDRVQAWATRSLGDDSLAGRFAFGMANGLLPCGLVYAALGLAVAAGSPLWGAAVMLAFGAGTTPVLASVALGIRRGMGRSLNARRGMAVLVLVSGLFSVWTRAGGGLVVADPSSAQSSVTQGVPVGTYLDVQDSLIESPPTNRLVLP